MSVVPPGTKPSRLHSWCYLIRFSFGRLARARLMVWVALGLLLFITFIIYLNTQMDRWGMWHWRSPRRGGPRFLEYLETLVFLNQGLPRNSSAYGIHNAVNSAFHAALSTSGFPVYSQWIVFSIFATFLMPLWCLSFSTDALGREREEGNLIWLLSRPLSRWSIYLAKFIAVLPWSMLLCLGGFAAMCLAAGRPGRLALQVYWPAVFWGALAFTALFQLMGVLFRRPAIVAILYSFFLETLLGNLPGYLKRASISFYTRCLMYDAAGDYGIRPERPELYLPVSGSTAWVVLAGLTCGLLLTGMIVFSRREYLEVE